MSLMRLFDRLRAVLFVIGGMSIFFTFTPQVTFAQQRDRQIYQTDSVGNVKYHAPSWAVQPDGRVIETNRYGEKMYHKQQYKVVGDQVMPVDSVGNPQPHKGSATWR
jgi:hypothetical protein